MEPWSFPSSFPELWKSLDEQQKGKLVDIASRATHSKLFPWVVKPIAEKIHTRPNKVPRDKAKFLLHIRTLCDAGNTEILPPVFFIYANERLQNVQNSVLECLDGEDTDAEGAYLPGPLAKWTGEVLHDFDEEDVRLNAQLNYIQDKERLWVHYPQMDFTVLEAAASRPRRDILPEPEDGEDVVDDEEELEDADDPLDVADLNADILAAEFEKLKDSFREVADILAAAAEGFRAGVLPDADIDPAIFRMRKKFSRLQDAVSDCRQDAGMDPFAEAPVSLAVLEAAIAQIRRHESIEEEARQRLEAALGILDSIESLTTADGRELPGLDHCRRGAADLRARIARNELPELPGELLADLKPYQAIVRMLEQDAVPDDPAAVDQVASIFGATFVFALARGFVRPSANSPAPTDSPAESSDSPIDTAPSEALQATPNAVSDAPDEAGGFEPVQPETAPVEPPQQEDHAESVEESGSLDALVAAAETSEEDAPLSEPATVGVDTAEETVAPVVAEPRAPEPAQAVPPPRPIVAEQIPQPSGFLKQEGETSAVLASVLVSARSVLSPRHVERLIWLALGEQKFSAAYHLATCLAFNGEVEHMDLPSRLRTLILGQALRNPVGTISEQLKIDYSMLANWQEPESEELALAYRLLMISSTLRPALLAPATNAKSLLAAGSRSLRGIDRLYWLSNQLSDYSVLQMPLDIAALEMIDSRVNLTQRLEAFQAEVKTWWARAPHLNFKYQPAQMVWQRWLNADSPVGRLILPILRNDSEELRNVKELVERLSTDAKIRTEINSEDRPQRGYGFVGKINYNALSVFTRHVRDAVEYARRWVALQEIRSADQMDYRRTKLLDLRKNIDSAQADIRAELAQAIAAASDLRVATALSICQRSFESLLALMHPKNADTAAEPSVKYLLSSDLLLIPGLPLTDEWEPQLGPDQLMRLLVARLAEPDGHSWDSAMRLLSEERRDHEAVDRIREYLRWEGRHVELLENLTALQDEHLKQCQNALNRQIEDCTRKVELGVSLGLVRDLQRAEYLDRIAQISRRLDSIRNFESEEAELRSIIAAIENSRLLQVQQVRERLAGEPIDPESSAYERIQAALDHGDVDTANEYIDLTLRGDTLPNTEEMRDAFRKFFPEAATRIDEYLNNPVNAGTIVSAVQSRKAIPGLNLDEVPDAQIEDAVVLLEAWTAMKKSKRAKPEHLKSFFERLGFTNVKVPQDSSQSQRAFLSMEVVPLKHRDQCPVPYFGSVSSGHYRVICIWDRPSEEEVVSLVRHGRQGAPAIVLYFGRVSEQKRRNIAQLSRADNLNFILIDEVIVTYLCGERGSRLPVLFDCALPFTFINPYTTASSIVPPEMFYGRRWERDQITDAMGSCFVYGGRQLGKTALLISIRDEFHHPSEGRVALWVDLRSTTDLARAFKDLNDVDLQLGDVRTEQKLLERLQAWLLADSKRRILLLLDEADIFLQSDSETKFSRTSALKGLMERTNRRFKVVFAGLHNVQRTTKQQNHPLAHFGEPICVGPLIERGESKEAKALIERPFWSMGFRFESPDLITRILSRTNYYPSLVQLYCNQIYQSVKMDHACLRGGPPYVITARHLEDAYSSKQFENAIREKFELTLNLDPRYRVLALIIALNSLQGSTQPMSVNEIREQAFSWWKLGFADSRTEEDFRVLLDEMLGLGVLREVNGGFVLRTTNLLSLLGRQDQIEQKLVQSSYEAPPPVYTAHVHRSPDRKQPWRRNPLNDQQHSDLEAERNSVTVIFGTKAAGVDDLEHFLSQSFDAGHFFNCDITAADRHAFRKYLDGVRGKAATGTSLVFVRNSPWTTTWIEEALAAGKGRTRLTSVVFVADPETAWGLVQDRAAIDALINAKKISTISLQPWHSSVLWRWLGDCGIGSNAAHELTEIGASTGHWPYVLEEFRNGIVSGGMPWKTALEHTATRLGNGAGRAGYMEAFGLDVAVPKTVLGEMASLGGQVLLNDLAEILDTISKDQIAAVFYWADRLGLIQPSQGGEWVLDPIVRKVLTAEKGAYEVVESAGTA